MQHPDPDQSRYVFRPQSIERLKRFCAGKVLLAFDFDGTLAGIVARPELVEVGGKTAALLAELFRFAPIAVISGRSRRNLRELLRASVPASRAFLLIGNHGLESPGADRRVTARARRLCSGWRRTLGPVVRHWPGVELENKVYSLSVHYRQVHGMRNSGARRRILELCASLKPVPQVILGKSVVNLLPAGDWNKGRALVDSMRGLRVQRAIYLGDDDTDEAVFSLPQARWADHGIFCVRVRRKKNSSARYYLRAQSEVNRFLGLLLTVLGSRGARLSAKNVR